MNLTRKGFAAAGALLIIVGAISAEAASRASIDRRFSAEVARILNSVKDQEEYLAELSAAEFSAFVECAQGVMADAPLARKEYVLAASSRDEMRQRFDEVALDNRAALKQRITLECA
jgi:hypothetical protein